MNFREVLANRLQDEKDAVLYYQELAAYAPNDIARRLMLRISREEERHADFLSWILRECEQATSADPIEPSGQRTRPKSRVHNRIRTIGR